MPKYASPSHTEMVLRTYRETLLETQDDGSLLVPDEGVLRELRLLTALIASRVREMDDRDAERLIWRGVEEMTRKGKTRKPKRG